MEHIALKVAHLKLIWVLVDNDLQSRARQHITRRLFAQYRAFALNALAVILHDLIGDAIPRGGHKRVRGLQKLTVEPSAHPNDVWRQKIKAYRDSGIGSNLTVITLNCNPSSLRYNPHLWLL